MSHLIFGGNIMGTNRINKMIESAISDEEKTGRLASTVKEVARQNGVNLTVQQVNDVISFVKDYIRHIPLYIDDALALAQRTGIKREIEQMIRELEAYWYEMHDVIPDHLGLMGVLDDAYASMSLLQQVSDYCKTTSGHAILSQDWSHANQYMRNLIGEPAASVIDQRVGITIAQNMMGQVMNRILSSGFAFDSGPDPIWGNASIDQIVDTQMGAMGIV